MELKNITPYSDFKKINEELTSDFSNTTGFAQSLVGRGFFGILKFFKKSVNIGRLEYLKRKLENEYFAGWLRFCALKGINLKDGTAPPDKLQDEKPQEDGDDGDGDGDDDSGIICQVYYMDYSTTNLVDEKQKVKDFLDFWNDTKTNNAGTMTPDQLAQVDDEIKECEEVLKYIDIKILINTSFSTLNGIVIATGMTFNQTNEVLLLTELDKIKRFLEVDAKACPTYKLSDKEKEIINRLETTLNPATIKTKCDELKLIYESFNNNGSYDLINEEFVTSNINTAVPIMQILGDPLNTMPSGVPGSASNKVKPYDYLKSIGINNVDEINFEACAKLWREKPDYKKLTSKMVSSDGIKKIQYAASRIIYQNKEQPGIHGEPAGGLNYTEDTSLRTAWERRVEKCTGEWNYFMNMRDSDYPLDPFKLMTLQEAYRKEGGAKDFDNMNKETAPIAENVAIDDKIGIRMIGGTPSNNDLHIMQYCYGDRSETAYLVFYTIKSPVGGVVSFLYVGNINISKIYADKIKDMPNEADRKREVSKYVDCVLDNSRFTKGCSKFNNYFKFINEINNVAAPAGTLPNSIVLSADFQNRSSSDEVKIGKTRMFMVFYEGADQNNTKFADITRLPTDPAKAKLKIFNEGNNRKFEDCSIAGLKSPKKINSYIGGIYVFTNDSWKSAYLPQLTNITKYKGLTEQLLIQIFIPTNIT